MNHSFPASPIIILIFTYSILYTSLYYPIFSLFLLQYTLLLLLYVLTLTYPSNVQQGFNLSWFSNWSTIYYIFIFFVTLPSILWYNALSPLSLHFPIFSLYLTQSILFLLCYILIPTTCPTAFNYVRLSPSSPTIPQYLLSLYSLYSKTLSTPPPFNLYQSIFVSPNISS